ncbi:hypothetical protein [Aureimonas sp. SA4125]|uniref:hypothetical protein n=1 Tax=Aureimonas sp. SA4125 TaxID=2826993 RepID=UPI001CC73255|nr:hypothetical protein [Aureimonas sp. SA4125]
MGTTLKAKFETRRDAEMAIERLVQEHGIERTDIFVTAAGSQNTAGTQESGSDNASAEPTREDRDDAALNGMIEVSVDLEDEGLAQTVRDAFGEFDGTQARQS